LTVSIIKFTRMQREAGIARRYGSFQFLADKKKKHMSCDGVHVALGAGHGDAEVRVMAEEAWACAQEAGFDVGEHVEAMPIDIVGTWIKRGSGVHDRVGPFVAYKAPGLVVKVTYRQTEIKATGCVVPTAVEAQELVAMFLAMVGDRDEVRVAGAQWSKAKVKNALS
jgi:hypothetical protein